MSRLQLAGEAPVLGSVEISFLELDKMGIVPDNDPVPGVYASGNVPADAEAARAHTEMGMYKIDNAADEAFEAEENLARRRRSTKPSGRKGSISLSRNVRRDRSLSPPDYGRRLPVLQRRSTRRLIQPGTRYSSPGSDTTSFAGSSTNSFAALVRENTFLTGMPGNSNSKGSGLNLKEYVAVMKSRKVQDYEFDLKRGAPFKLNGRMHMKHTLRLMHFERGGRKHFCKSFMAVTTQELFTASFWYIHTVLYHRHNPDVAERLLKKVSIANSKVYQAVKKEKDFFHHAIPYALGYSICSQFFDSFPASRMKLSDDEFQLAVYEILIDVLFGLEFSPLIIMREHNLIFGDDDLRQLMEVPDQLRNAVEVLQKKDHSAKRRFSLSTRLTHVLAENSPPLQGVPSFSMDPSSAVGTERSGQVSGGQGLSRRTNSRSDRRSKHSSPTPSESSASPSRHSLARQNTQASFSSLGGPSGTGADHQISRPLFVFAPAEMIRLDEARKDPGKRSKLSLFPRVAPPPASSTHGSTHLIRQEFNGYRVSPAVRSFCDLFPRGNDGASVLRKNMKLHRSIPKQVKAVPRPKLVDLSERYDSLVQLRKKDTEELFMQHNKLITDMHDLDVERDGVLHANEDIRNNFCLTLMDKQKALAEERRILLRSKDRHH
jgi:hypothetical protein